MSKKVTVGYKYYLGMHMILCHGPIDAVTQIRIDGRTAWSGSNAGGAISVNAPELFGGETREGGVSGTVDIEMGAATQGQNSYLVSKLGALLPGFRGVVGAVLRQVYVGMNPYLKRWGFRGQRIHLRQNGLAQWYDAKAAVGINLNGAHILRECLTDPDWGMGYPETDIDDTSFMAAADTLYTEGMGLSLLWDRSMPLEDFMKEVQKHIAGSIYVSRSTGKFMLKLIRADYTPATLLSLDENSISKVTDFKRQLIGELVNSVTVVFWDADLGKNNSVTVQDVALAAQQSATIGTTKQFPGLTNGTIATKVASRELKALSTPLASAVLYTNRLGASLNVGDVFKFSWAQYGVSGAIMRVANIELGALDSNVVKLTCVEDVFGVSNAIYAPPPPSGWVDPMSAPAPCPYQLILDTPYWEMVQHFGESNAQSMATATFGSFMAAGVRPSGDAINCKLYTNTGTGYEERDEFDFCPTAVLAADATYNGTAWSIGAGVDLDLVRVGSYALVDSELVIVKAITDTTLQTGRGTLDTTPSPHLTGARIYFLDDFLGSDNIEYTTADSGRGKLLPVTGRGTLAIASAAELIIPNLASRAFKPYPPGQVRLNTLAYPNAVRADQDLVVSWAHRDRLQQTASLIDTETASIGPEAGTTYDVLITHENGGPTYTSQTGITGVTATFTVAALLAAGAYGRVAVQVRSVRDAQYSYQTHLINLTRAGYGMAYGYAYGGA